MAVNCLACGSENEYVVAIPGTENVTLSRSSWSISVSPDEQYLAFWELRKEGGDLYDATFCTLDLTNYSKTTHRIQELYGQFSQLGPVKPWDQIGNNFESACWLDGSCYITLRFLTVQKSLCFTPGKAQATWASPTKSLTCSDCPPPGFVRLAVENLVGGWLLAFERLYSVASPDNRNGRRVYHVDDEYDGARILRTDSNRSETVIQYSHKLFKDPSIYTIRISPNERYLAYGLFLKLRAPMPLPDQKIELHVYDLLDKKDHKISTGYRYISNLIWGPDSKRLYFAGIQGENRAVYRVDVDEALAE
jgi:hypothetical protein